jgi:hypothetical protein
MKFKSSDLVKILEVVKTKKSLVIFVVVVAVLMLAQYV